MNQVFVKLRIPGKGNKYRKMLTIEDGTSLYRNVSDLVESSVPYTPDGSLQSGEWFAIHEFSEQGYSLDITKSDFETVDFDSLQRDDYKQIDFLFAWIDKNIYFQNVSKARLVRKKHILSFGEDYKYVPDSDVLTINEYPDAIYNPNEDVLYFQRLESISGIFKGIEELYREATMLEVVEFLDSEFITLKGDFEAAKVKTLNRKRIALARDILSGLCAEDKEMIISYIKVYCPDLSAEEQKFTVSSDDDLKMLLYGIEQRYYTTPVGNEQRVASSTYPLKQQGGITNGQA